MKKAYLRMSSKQKVLVLVTPLNEVPYHTDEYKEFSSLFDIVTYEPTTKEKLIEVLQSDEYSDISAIWTTATSVFQFGGIAQFIQYFPKSVKAYVFPWVGYSEKESKLLHERNIKFCNVGDVSKDDVADIALYLAMATFRFFNFFEYQFRPVLSTLKCRNTLGSKSWDDRGEPLPPPERANLAESSSIGGKEVGSPTNKIAGIIGFGSIGKEIGRRLGAIRMKVVYTKRTPLTKEEENELGYQAEFIPTIAELLSSVDLIIIATPHSPETINIINRESLKTVKKGVRIVNVGRGSAIDEEALLEGLDNGTVNSVGLDVYRNEPSNIDQRFAKRWDVTMTPHLGNVSTDNTVQANFRCMNNLKNILLEGGDGISPVYYKDK